MLTMLLATWAGMLRMGWVWPVLFPTLPAGHGPLMVSGLLGTVIGLERSVALRKRWTYGAPLLTALGGFLIIAGLPDWLGAITITAGSLVAVAVFVVILRQQPEPFNRVLLTAAVSWSTGNLFWLFGWGVSQVVAWWMVFLVLTVAGERLALNRLLNPTPAVRRAFTGAVGLLLTGAATSLWSFTLGWQVTGAGLLGLALWLWRNDIARRTIRHPDLTGFIAACLLSGFVWLAVGGALAIWPGIQALHMYDAILHSVFLGFIFAMIFGHAPVIFPAVLWVEMRYHPSFYSHLTLLHLSLLLRVGGDLLHWAPARLWGAVLNGVSLLLFAANTALSVYAARRNMALTAAAPPAGD